MFKPYMIKESSPTEANLTGSPDLSGWHRGVMVQHGATHDLPVVTIYYTYTKLQVTKIRVIAFFSFTNLRNDLAHILHGAGIFTYKTGSFIRQM